MIPLAAIIEICGITGAMASNPHHFEGGGYPPLFSVHCGPEGPAAGAKRLHAAEGREGERSEAVVPEATH